MPKRTVDRAGSMRKYIEGALIRTHTCIINYMCKIQSACMFALGWIVVRSASLVRLLQHFHSHIAVSGSHGVEMRGMCQYVHSVIMLAFQKLIASAANLAGKAFVIRADFPISRTSLITGKRHFMCVCN